MSFIDWQAAALPSVIQGQNTQNATSQLELMQKQRALQALHGVNLSDQSSVGGALNGLTSLGMADQAKALLDLSNQRAITSQSVPLATSAIGLAQGKINAAAQTGQQASPSSDQAPDLDAGHRQILQQGADAVNDLLSYDDPTLRAAAADVYRQKFAKMGLPQQNVDEVLGDLSDVGLKAHEKFLTAAANGDATAQHPTGYAASQALLNSDPIYRNAEGTLTGPMADPTVQAALKQYGGLDLGPGIEQALNETAPGRQQAAGAAFAAPAAEASARGTAIGSGSVGSPPVAGSRLTFDAQGQPDAWILPDGTTQAIQQAAGAQAGGTAAVTARYTPVTVPTGVPGQTKTESAAQFAGNPPAVSATAAQSAGAVGGAQANTEQATNFENYSAGYNQRKANLENLRQSAGDISTGPQSTFWGHIGALASEYGIKTPLAPTANQAAAYEEVKKMAQSVLSQQKDALGLPNTNQSVTLATGATPNEQTSPLGLQRLAGVLEGNEDYINATRQAWEKWKAQGHGYETYQQFVPQFLQTFHPQVFQAQYLDAPQQAKVRQQFGPARFDAETAAAKRLGFLGGQ